MAFAVALILVSFTRLAAQSEEFGKWKPLWNGKDPSGWIVAKDDRVIPAPWKVEDGAFTNGGDGGKDICTTEQFESYELELDYKVAKSGNSGVYLRGWIMFQGDHSQVWFRNLRIRPLVAPSDGWRPLWNGKNLVEFNARGDQRAKDGLRWKVEDGAFTNTQWRGDGHDIWTNDSFGN